MIHTQANSRAFLALPQSISNLMGSSFAAAAKVLVGVGFTALSPAALASDECIDLAGCERGRCCAAASLEHCADPFRRWKVGDHLTGVSAFVEPAPFVGSAFVAILACCCLASACMFCCQRPNAICVSVWRSRTSWLRCMAIRPNCTPSANVGEERLAASVDCSLAGGFVGWEQSLAVTAPRTTQAMRRGGFQFIELKRVNDQHVIVAVLDAAAVEQLGVNIGMQRKELVVARRVLHVLDHVEAALVHQRSECLEAFNLVL